MQAPLSTDSGLFCSANFAFFLHDKLYFDKVKVVEAQRSREEAEEGKKKVDLKYNSPLVNSVLKNKKKECKTPFIGGGTYC